MTRVNYGGRIHRRRLEIEEDEQDIAEITSMAMQHLKTLQ